MAMKTLLVGLGGTGCEIVTRVKNLIQNADENVQFVGFDTDGSWGGVDGLPMVYTSRDMTVRSYLRDVPNWRDWFPDNASLMQRNMVKGAGQVRTLSRLAFAETVASNRLGPLREAIRNLKVERGEITPTNFRVMVISSFAGGTGSGMFIQAALFLRQFIRQNYGGEVIVRGLFALPDLFMDTNPSPVQQESMYANAYAALRELNAINMATLSRDPAADQVDMSIDRIFDSKADRYHAEKKPFDFIFLVDNINAEGKVMRSMEEYKNLLTTAAYMQVYSPMTKDGDSREDNAILSVIGHDGRPLYGSVGAARIVYPYRDLVNYCGLRATVDSVSELWTLIDVQYRRDDAENRRMMQLDPSVKPLDRGVHFLATLQQMMESGNTRLNFLHRALTNTDDDGKTMDRVEAYYESVYSYVSDKLKNDEQVRDKRNATGLYEKHFKEKAGIVPNVTKNETALKDYLDTVNNRIMLLRGSLGQAIIPSDLNSVLDPDADWNILKLLRMGGSVAHPLALRALLYKLRGMLQEQYEKCEGENAGLIQRINRYFSKEYDLVETPGVETAAMRAGDSKRGGTRFRAEYLQKSGEQKNHITRYCESKVIAVVFEDVLKRLNALIRQLERLFDSLGSICAALEKEAEILETKKHSDSGSSDSFVCASPEWKRELYASLDFNCSDSNENHVYDAILYTLYGEAMKELEYAAKKHILRKKGSSAKKEEQERVSTMGTLFRRSIMARNTEDLERECANQLDIDVFAALALDAEDDPGRMKELLKSAYKKSQPYLKTDQDHCISLLSRTDENADGEGCAYTMVFWGIHPEVEESIMQTQNPASLPEFFRVDDHGYAPEVVSNEDYSRYEISCYQALYCVALNEVPKFVETGDHFGVFYQNYANRIRSMTEEGSAITPHLDIRWHSRRYLPMISGEKNAEDDRNTARAMWLALIYNGLPDYQDEEGRAVYANFGRVVGKSMKFQQDYPPCDLRFQGKPVQIGNPYELFKALQYNELVRDRFLKVFTPAFEEDRMRGMGSMEFEGPRARTFAKSLISEGCPERNALNLLGNFAAHADMRAEELNLMHSALTELIEQFTEGLPSAKQGELRTLIYNASSYADSKEKRDRMTRYIPFAYWQLA